MTRIPGLLLALSVFAAFAGLATSAAAQNYPWCSNFADGWGGTNCGFTSYDQCMATVRGSGGFCAQNNSYTAPAAAAAARQARRKPGRSKSF